MLSTLTAPRRPEYGWPSIQADTTRNEHMRKPASIATLVSRPGLRPLAVERVPYRDLTYEWQKLILEWLEWESDDIADHLGDPVFLNAESYLVDPETMDLVSPRSVAAETGALVDAAARYAARLDRPTMVRVRDMALDSTIVHFLIVPFRRSGEPLLSLQKVS